MKIQGSVVKEQGVTFAIVIVKPHALQNPATREQFRRSMKAVFPGMPIILMAQNSQGIPTYHGRKDIVSFLASIDHHRIPWKEYTVS